jgi:hypothetical protein
MEWSIGTSIRFRASPSVQRQGLSDADRWFQVAPGGGTVALWTAATGLVVFNAAGEEMFRRPHGVTSFRFSPEGDRIAIASAKGIQIVTPGRKEARPLASVRGADWLQWTEDGLIAKAEAKLYRVDFGGGLRKLADLRPEALVVAAKQRVVYFAGGSMMALDLGGDAAPAAMKLADRDPVINAEISPDGRRVLFATAARVFLRENGGGIKRIADAEDVRSLDFSHDGESYLWARARGGGELVTRERSIPLPARVRSAHFKRDQSGDVVVTTEDGVSIWKPKAGAPSMAGGMSPDDGVNFGGDVAGSEGVVIFYFKKTGEMKETQTPRFPRQ